MIKPTKDETITLLKLLHKRGLTFEELAVKLGRTSQTIWAWSSPAKSQKHRIPCKMDFMALEQMLTEEVTNDRLGDKRV